MIISLVVYLLLALVTAFFISLFGFFPRSYETSNRNLAIALWPITWLVGLFMLVGELGDMLGRVFDRWLERKFGG